LAVPIMDRPRMDIRRPEPVATDLRLRPFDVSAATRPTSAGARDRAMQRGEIWLLAGGCATSLALSTPVMTDVRVKRV